MAKPPKIRDDGLPDGRGHAEGSRSTQFAQDDGRVRPGRRKGSKSLKTIYQTIAAIPLTVDLGNGKKKRITSLEGMVHKQRQKALNGHQRATERFLERIADYSPPEVQLDLTAQLLEEDAALLASARGRGLIAPSPEVPPPTSGDSSAGDEQ
jgi:hypothetical protein